jgi:hypothetical protein
VVYQDLTDLQADQEFQDSRVIQESRMVRGQDFQVSQETLENPASQVKKGCLVMMARKVFQEFPETRVNLANKETLDQRASWV